MTQRINDMLAGCGDGNPTISLGPTDARSVGLEAGSYTADEIRQALESDSSEPSTRQADPPATKKAATKKAATKKAATKKAATKKAATKKAATD